MQLPFFCYGEQSFTEFNFPIGSTRFRFLYYLMAWLELAFVGNHVTWFVPINIVLNTLAAGFVSCILQSALFMNGIWPCFR